MAGFRTNRQVTGTTFTEDDPAGQRIGKTRGAKTEQSRPRQGEVRALRTFQSGVVRGVNLTDPERGS